MAIHKWKLTDAVLSIVVKHYEKVIEFTDEDVLAWKREVSKNLEPLVDVAEQAISLEDIEMYCHDKAGYLWNDESLIVKEERRDDLEEHLGDYVYEMANIGTGFEPLGEDETLWTLKYGRQ